MYNFLNLDEKTRELMISEINWAIKNNELYYSTRFIDGQKEKWQQLLLEAAKNHNEHWLAFQIENNSMLKDFEEAEKPKGGYTIKHVPNTASETLASGQFNRYYILGLAQRAVLENKNALEVYRAKDSQEQRDGSEALIGRTFNPAELIEQLRTTQASFKSELAKPNSGISVKL
ncbi:MAG: hypothetical protein WCS88_03485 [Patescibacteria group bacterium]|jgi:hypothetical protein